MNGKGRKGKGDQTSTAEQHLRHSKRRKFCNRKSTRNVSLLKVHSVTHHARDEMERILYKRTVDDKNHKKVVSTSCVYNKHVIIAITSKGVIRCL